AYPKVAEFRSDLARSLHELSGPLFKDGRREEGLRSAQDAVRHQQTVVALKPKDAAASQALQAYRLGHLGMLVDTGDHAAAAKAVTDGLDATPRREDHRLAGLLARCLAVVQKEEKLPEAKREELARAYGDQAMTLLRRAVTAGFNDVNYLKTTADFDAL